MLGINMKITSLKPFRCYSQDGLFYYINSMDLSLF